MRERQAVCRDGLLQSTGVRPKFLRVRAIVLAGVLAAGALLVSAPLAANSGWTLHSVPSAHFSIATPAAWVAIPQSRAGQQALVRSLQREGRSDALKVLREFVGDHWQHVASRKLDAVELPQTLPSDIATDVIVDVKPLPTGVSEDQSTLKQIVTGLYGQLKTSSGMHLEKPAAVRLEAGPSYLLFGSATASGFGGARTGFAFYLLLHAGHIYSIECRTDARFFDAHAALFRRIAGTFRYT